MSERSGFCKKGENIFLPWFIYASSNNNIGNSTPVVVDAERTSSCNVVNMYEIEHSFFILFVELHQFGLFDSIFDRIQ